MVDGDKENNVSSRRDTRTVPPTKFVTIQPPPAPSVVARSASPFVPTKTLALREPYVRPPITGSPAPVELLL